MVALPRRTGIAADVLPRRFAVNTGVLVVGIAHARRRPRGEHRLHRGAGLGIEAPPDIAEPVGARLVDGQIASPRPVPVGELAVLIDQIGQLVGGLPQLLGFEPAGDFGQLRLGQLPSLVIDEARQPVEEPPNDLHMLDTDGPALLRSGGMRQHRLERLAAHRRARPQILGLMDAPMRLVLRDPQQRRQRRGQRRLTQLLDRHLRQGSRQPMRHRRQPSHQRLPLMGRRRPLSRRQHIHRLGHQCLKLRTDRGDALHHSHRTHGAKRMAGSRRVGRCRSPR